MAKAKAKPSQRSARVARAAARSTGRRKNRDARGFDAGKPGRRLRAIPSSSFAINSQIRMYGKTVVRRSRYLAANNPYATAAKEAYTSALVGTGIKPSWLIPDKTIKKELQEAWRAWTDEADADQLTDYYGLQGIIASEMFEAGECFVRIRERFASDGLTVPMQLQLLPSEMLPTDYNIVLSNGRRIECGIQFDAIGRREGYWFYRSHPGEQFNAAINTTLLTFVPASEVLHLFKPIRAGQIRGLPHTLAGMVTLAMIDLYDDAELERKRIAALFGAFVTRPRGEDDQEHPLSGTQSDPANADSDFTLEPGAVVDLADGQDVKFAEPADVGATYEAFQYRNLLRAAAGFGTPYSDMTGDLRQTSYGSIRAGLVAFRRRIEAQQHHVIVFQLCRPIVKRWLELAVLYKAVPSLSAAVFLANPRGYAAVKHIPPKWEWVDPLKDRQAEKLAVDSGFKARSDVIEAEGYDPEEVDARIKADQERASEMGIKFITLSASIVVSPEDEEPESLVDPRGASSDSDDESEMDFG